MGASGSGKSSLLRLLNRLDEPTSGTVYLDGIDYKTIAPRELRRRLGMVTQRPFLFPGTVASNLQFGPQQRGEVLPDEAVHELLRQVGMDGFADETSPIYPAASNNGYRLPAPWRISPRCCCSTSQPRLSTKTPSLG